MVTVIDRTRECLAGTRQGEIHYGNLTHLVLHKTGVSVRELPWLPDPLADKDCNAFELARRFRRPNKYTGGLVPYHVLVDVDGRAEQMLPLSMQGAHAVKRNAVALGIAYLGENPTQSQIVTMFALATVLVPINAGLEVVGHTELPGASRDPRKVCPGSKLDLAWFRSAVAAKLAPGWQLRKRPEIEDALRVAGFAL